MTFEQCFYTGTLREWFGGFFKKSFDKKWIFLKNIICRPRIKMNKTHDKNVQDPEKKRKTLFVWPEGIFYESYKYSKNFVCF